MILKLSNKWRTPNYARAFSESDKYLFAKVSGTHAFGRVDVEGPFYYCDSDGRQCVRILHPNEVLADILKENPELDNEASSQFKDDMENSVANMALALAYQAYEMQHSNEPLLEIILMNKIVICVQSRQL